MEFIILLPPAQTLLWLYHLGGILIVHIRMNIQEMSPFLRPLPTMERFTARQASEIMRSLIFFENVYSLSRRKTGLICYLGANYEKFLK